MIIYFDTSALAKLIVIEKETAALRAWIGSRPNHAGVTNSVGAVELQRFAARVSHPAMAAATQLLARLDQLELTPLAISRAAQLPPPEVRTLDALHIASASELADLEALVTYDERMRAAAIGCGLPVANPS
ncbi:MAG: type II toxin-antitoxin system VapC family toxin [Actinomycetia bacterium]|nr:type II toxin-antitoxin system VapC family toxin [Actinomycetes bacterium]